MNILITGKNSYIGENIKKHLESFGYVVDEVDTIDDDWKYVDYEKYQSVIHVAAIVHDDAKVASEELFFKVNAELPLEIATIAKSKGVKQFIFMSTMAVFGVDKSLDKDNTLVCSETQLTPCSLYGKTKLVAENKLCELSEDNFKVSFIRPPNVYGPGCKGNYINMFKKLADLMLVCPYAYTSIRQSMLYIDNLSELIRLILENNSDGVYMPQDDCAPNTVEIITTIREISGKKTYCSKVCGYIVKLLSKLSLVAKLYGGIRYGEEISRCFDNKYQIVSFKGGMKLTYKDM